MTIGTPFGIGNASGTGAASVGIAVTHAPAQGDLVMVMMAFDSGSVASVTDTQGNSYTVVDNIAGTSIALALAYALNPAQLTLSDTITVNFSGAPNSQVRVAGCSGITSLAALDRHNNTSQGTAATSAGSVSTGTLGNASELLIGMISATVNTGALVPGGSWTNGPISGGSPLNTRWSYQIVSSTASVAWAPTWPNAANYVSDVVSFIGATPAPFNPWPLLAPVLAQ